MNIDNTNLMNSPFTGNKSIGLNSSGGTLFIPNNKGSGIFPVKSKFLLLVFYLIFALNVFLFFQF
jgi:hypothetical protein